MSKAGPGRPSKAGIFRAATDREVAEIDVELDQRDEQDAEEEEED